MLIFSYGMQKSASTFGYQLIGEVLSQNGHSQERVESAVIKPGGWINFAETLEDRALDSLDRSIGPDRLLAVKTHQPPTDWVRSLLEDGRACAFASFRDPRDIALSLVDAGAKARQKGLQAFSEYRAIGDTIDDLRQRFQYFLRWRQISGVAVLGYDEVAFDTVSAITKIARHLSLPVDADSILAKYRSPRSIGQFNKGIQNRFEREMTAEQLALFEREFADFIALYESYEKTRESRQRFWQKVRNRSYAFARRRLRG